MLEPASVAHNARTVSRGPRARRGALFWVVPVKAVVMIVITLLLLCVGAALSFERLVPESISEVAGESVTMDAHTWGRGRNFRRVMIVRVRNGRTVRAVMPRAVSVLIGKRVIVQERIGSVFGGRTYYFLRYREEGK